MTDRILMLIFDIIVRIILIGITLLLIFIPMFIIFASGCANFGEKYIFKPRTGRGKLALFCIILGYFSCLYITFHNIMFDNNGNNIYLIAIPIIATYIVMLLVTSDTIHDFIQKNIMIPFFYNSKIECDNCILELSRYDDSINIYCYDKTLTDDILHKHHFAVIKSIENPIDIVSLFLSLYDNYSRLDSFSYNDFIAIAQKRNFFIRSLEVVEPDFDFYKMNELLEYNNIDLTSKKLNINSSTEEEITDLPFINIIQAKNIVMHIFEKNGFKTFWEFADFLKLTKTQAKILAKLVVVEPKQQYMQEQIEYTKEIKDNYIRKVDI